MSSLFGGKTPPIERGTMPDITDEANILARRKEQDKARARMGRQSTMLTDMLKSLTSMRKRVVQ